MTKLYIEYHADNSSMGDTPAADCNAYRAWAKRQLIAEYPDHEISIYDKPSLYTVLTNDDERREEIECFCQQLWDECPWDWH